MHEQSCTPDAHAHTHYELKAGARTSTCDPSDPCLTIQYKVRYRTTYTCNTPPSQIRPSRERPRPCFCGVGRRWRTRSSELSGYFSVTPSGFALLRELDTSSPLALLPELDSPLALLLELDIPDAVRPELSEPDFLELRAFSSWRDDAVHGRAAGGKVEVRDWHVAVAELLRLPVGIA